MPPRPTPPLAEPTEFGRPPLEGEEPERNEVKGMELGSAFRRGDVFEARLGDLGWRLLFLEKVVKFGVSMIFTF